MSMSKNMDTIEKLEFISDAKRLIRKIETFTTRYVAIQMGTIDDFPVLIIANSETWIECNIDSHWDEESIFEYVTDFEPVGDCRCLELLLGGFMFEYDYGVLK